MNRLSQFLASRLRFQLSSLSLAWILVAGVLSAQTQVLFVSEEGAGRVSKVDASGTVTTFASGLDRPFGLAVDSGGNLFVLSQGTGYNGTIKKFSAGGSFLGTIATGVTGGEGLAFDASDNLYVATNNGSTGSILKITPGLSVSTFATGFATPAGLAFDSAGDLWMLDYGINPYGHGGLYQISPAGVVNTFINPALGLNGPLGIAIGPDGDFYIAINTTSYLTRIYRSNAYVDSLTHVSNPYGTAINAAGEVFITDGSGNIRKLIQVEGSEGFYDSTEIFASGLTSPTYLVFASAIPEPSAYAAVAGLAGLVMAVWRRRVAAGQSVG